MCSATKSSPFSRKIEKTPNEARAQQQRPSIPKITKQKGTSLSFLFAKNFILKFFTIYYYLNILMLVVFIIFNIKIIGEANFIVIIISYLESSKVIIISLFNSSRLLNNKYCIAIVSKFLNLTFSEMLKWF